MVSKKPNLGEKQYETFARKFKVADEQFPDVTRPLIYSLIEDTQSGARLLDMGCGYGKDLEYFKKKGFEIFGIDISSEMIGLARERVPQANLYTGSFDALPYPDNYFDVLFSRYALQHSHNLVGAFKESSRVLRKGGHLVFLVTHPMRHYFEKSNKDYWAEEDISSVILDGELTVEEPSHTLSEYLSPFMLSNFVLEEFQEKHDPAAKNFEGFGRYPRIMIMKYKKK